MNDKKDPLLASHHLRVLVADDVEATRESTQRMLSLFPDLAIIGTAQNGLEAVRLMREKQVDIAFMDIKMPKMDGLQATQMMTKENPVMACVILSAERDEETILEAMVSGASAYLMKPYTAEQLTHIIERVAPQVRHRKRLWEGKGGLAGDEAAEKQLRRERDGYMIALANEYNKGGRTDERALMLFESLASNPNCDGAHLEHLAQIYTTRKLWTKLKQLVGRLEASNAKSDKSKPTLRRNVNRI